MNLEQFTLSGTYGLFKVKILQVIMSVLPSWFILRGSSVDSANLLGSTRLKSDIIIDLVEISQRLVTTSVRGCDQ